MSHWCRWIQTLLVMTVNQLSFIRSAVKQKCRINIIPILRSFFRCDKSYFVPGECHLTIFSISTCEVSGPNKKKKTIQWRILYTNMKFHYVWLNLFLFKWNTWYYAYFALFNSEISAPEYCKELLCVLCWYIHERGLRTKNNE